MKEDKNMALLQVLKDMIDDLQKDINKELESKNEEETESKEEDISPMKYMEGCIESVGSFGSALNKLIYMKSLDKTCALRRAYFSPDTFIIIDELKVEGVPTTYSPFLTIFYTDKRDTQHAEPYIPDYEDLFAEDWEIIIKD